MFAIGIAIVIIDIITKLRNAVENIVIESATELDSSF